MLILLLFVLASEPNLEAPSFGALGPLRRDPFVRPELWKLMRDDRATRLTHLLRELDKRRVPPGYTTSLLARDIEMYPPVRFGGFIDWNALRKKTLSDTSVARGMDFYRAHQETFDMTAERYGVPALSLVALIRIESDLGEFAFDKNNARNYVLNVFYTKLIRAANWRPVAATLADFVAYCWENEIDPLTIRGSWAGAFGLVQFMPFNVKMQAVDGNGDGHIDLFDVRDAVPSAANFLVNHGWHRNRLRALVAYYGERSPYQTIAFAYEERLKEELSKPRTSSQ